MKYGKSETVFHERVLNLGEDYLISKYYEQLQARIY